MLPHRGLRDDKEEYVWNVALLGHVLIFPCIIIKVNAKYHNPKQAGLLMAQTLQE